MENVLFKISLPGGVPRADRRRVRDGSSIRSVKDRIDDIAKITIRTHESAIRIIDKKGPLANPADRDHCIQYMVAVPLIHGRLTAADYEDNVAPDPRIDALRDKMTCVEDKQFSTRLPRPRQALDRERDHDRVQGRHASTKEVVVEYPIGHRRRRKRRHAGAGREVPHQPRAPLPGEAAAGDPRRRARREAARSRCPCTNSST